MVRDEGAPVTTEASGSSVGADGERKPARSPRPRMATEPLSGLESIMWRLGHDAALRMTVGNLMILDRLPATGALLERLEALAANSAPASSADRGPDPRPDSSDLGRAPRLRCDGSPPGHGGASPRQPPPGPRPGRAGRGVSVRSRSAALGGHGHRGSRRGKGRALPQSPSRRDRRHGWSFAARPHARPTRSDAFQSVRARRRRARQMPARAVTVPWSAAPGSRVR